MTGQQQAIYDAHKHIIESVVGQVGIGLRTSFFDYEDMRSVCHMAFHDAVVAYDESKMGDGQQVKNYLWKIVRFRLLDEARTVLGRSTSPKYAHVKARPPVSLDNDVERGAGSDYYAPGGGNNARHSESIVDRRRPGTATVDDRDQIENFLKKLTPDLRHLVVRYYLDGRTMLQIGDELGLSESRVSQMMGELVKRGLLNDDRVGIRPNGHCGRVARHALLAS